VKLADGTVVKLAATGAGHCWLVKPDDFREFLERQNTKPRAVSESD